MKYLLILLVLVGGYLVGSISSAVLVGRAFLHDDIRKFGSGNAGTTNVLRTCGKKAALLCALGDFLKGFVPAIVGKAIFSAFDLTPEVGAYLAGMAAVLGHLFPLYFGFKGGKGVMTSAGVMAGIDPISTLISLLVFVLVVAATRYVSLGSIVVAVVYPVVTTLRVHLANGPSALCGCLAAVFGITVIIMHHQNISRLINHTENKLRF